MNVTESKDELLDKLEQLESQKQAPVVKSGKRRTFKGKTEFSLTIIDEATPATYAATYSQREADKRERHFHQRMLRAYHKGKDFFFFGFDTNPLTGQRTPKQYPVLQAWE